MSIIGPRPLAVAYLPYYTEEERHRHDISPGLTGLAQVNGRNSIDWNTKFMLDVTYVNSISLFADLSILCKTVLCILKKSDIGSRNEGTLIDFDVYRMMRLEENNEYQRK
jgi:lipopolysaccharide/colanic/teichoic acid biosynthesis glycosyltransferase